MPAIMSASEVLERLKPEFERRAAPYTHKPSALLALLHAVQEADGFITPEAEAAVAEFLTIGRNQVHEAVTFYTLFRQQKLGRCHVQICQTLSCDLLGASELAAEARSRTGMGPREATADGRLSWETVECLGCCEKAPAVQVNNEPFEGPMTAASFRALLDELSARQGSNGR